MLKYSQPRVTLLLLCGLCAGIVTACFDKPIVEAPTAPAVPVASSGSASPVANTPTPAASPQTTSPAQPDPYQLAIERASSAFTIGRSAQSRDDWRLVASRWQQAIRYLESVPATNPNHAQAQGKLAEYQRNLSYAQQQASLPTTPESSGVVAIAPNYSQPAPENTVSALPQTTQQPGEGRVFQVPIVRRAGGTPVISVIFNGNQTYNMIVDTGASGTVITQQMAIALGVTPVGQAQVDTASARAVSFPLGYVRTMQVEGAVANNVLVAIAGPELDIGLLGHDFFGNYDVTVRQNVVEFRER